MFTLPPVPSTIQSAAPLVVLLCFAAIGALPWWVMLVLLALLPLGIVQRRRLKLALDPRGVTVTVRRTHVVAWSDVVRFEVGSFWYGGTRIVTTAGVLRSPVPCTDMGWRARPDQIAQLEAFRLRWSDAAQR